MSEALAAVFPAPTLQTGVVHLIRNSLDLTKRKERKPLAVALRAIYTAPSAEGAGTAVERASAVHGARGFPPSSPRGGAPGRT